jgi:hypothetical protein
MAAKFLGGGTRLGADICQYQAQRTHCAQGKVRPTSLENDARQVPIEFLEANSPTTWPPIPQKTAACRQD